MILEHHRTGYCPMMTLLEFCAPGFIAPRRSSKVIHWDTLYLVFKDRLISANPDLDASGFVWLPSGKPFSPQGNRDFT
ncbi:MAG TPA: hypothetical protein VN228_12955 [Pyrinomonadaceae bacterium]|nr:hypothetical protein [Pyrinomonadaceae bacterium]